LLRIFTPSALTGTRTLRPNIWDIVVLPLIMAVLALLAFGGSSMSTPYNVGDAITISLDPTDLPYYLLRTGMRMGIALALSMVFTLTYGTLAAKSRKAEQVLIPTLDVLQSIPILGFLSITVTGFIALFPGNLLGMECASIFAIFTSQAWNMAFSFYSSLRTVPADLLEASEMFHVSSWQRFWRLELPFGIPGLIWNTMMSVSGGWFFVVASEAISVSGQQIMLPGVGSYIAVAIQQKDLVSIGWAVLTMAVGIMAYDQLFFRPLVAWSDKFRYDSMPGEVQPESWLLTLLQRSRLVQAAAALPAAFWEWSLRLMRRRHDGTYQGGRFEIPDMPWFDKLWSASVFMIVGFGLYQCYLFVVTEVTTHEIGLVFIDTIYTTIRVFVLIMLAALFWVPVGIWIGTRPKLAQNVQALAQFMAAFPANLIFPVAVIMIVRYHLSVEIWTSPLMILGTQWYILFNVIAGALTIPTDLKDVSGNLGLSGWLKWKRFLLPAVFPAFLTGAITASGGSWNASIVSELVSWGDTTLTATGVGSYIADATAKGDFPRVALGVGVMCIFVMTINRFFWRKLYNAAAERLKLG